MIINADFKKVFEIGPVFRAEKSISNRHMCEFTGLDIEIQLTPPFDYLEIVGYLWKMLKCMFRYIETKNIDLIKYINEKHPFEPFVCSDQPFIIKFADGVKLLDKHGFQQNIHEDLSTENEKNLGSIIKSKFGFDLFVLSEYPESTRPFYTKKSENIGYTKSYDIIMRGQEICSGAQRENNYDVLIKQMENLGLKTELFEDYLNSFTAFRILNASYFLYIFEGFFYLKLFLFFLSFSMSYACKK